MATMMDNPLNQRYKIFIQNSIPNVYEMAKTIHMDQSTFKKQLSSPRGVSIETISKTLDTFPDLSSEWLMRGIGPMRVSNSVPSQMEGNTDKKSELHAEIARLKDELKESHCRCLKLEGQIECLKELYQELISKGIE
jgi:hypothetical protein